jgi:superfamily II DNA/RNA helicase/cold shock CspA family protein
LIILIDRFSVFVALRSAAREITPRDVTARKLGDRRPPNVPTTFAQLGLPDAVCDALRASGIDSPFPIQESAIPDALAGRDVCAQAPTGSGKTLAFGLPMLVRSGHGHQRHPASLILVPTRELADQIVAALRPLARTVDLRLVAVYGGVGFGEQRTALRKGVDVVVGCPGRIEDLISQGEMRLDHVTFAVIDEADRMADVGFLPAVRRLLDLTSKSRQTLLFSATMEHAVASLIRDYQTDPVTHRSVADLQAPDTARHLFLAVKEGDRTRLTAEAIGHAGSAIVFCRTRRRADRIALQLQRLGVKAETIHGGRSQQQRNRALAALNGGRVQALVATDVAARGIHVDGLACVVHYDAPEDDAAYVHRSGRTGRAGASGVVLSLVDEGAVGRNGLLRKPPAPGIAIERVMPGGLAEALVVEGAPIPVVQAPVESHREERVEEHAPQRENRPPTRRERPARTTESRTGGAPSVAAKDDNGSQDGEVTFFNPGKGYGFISRANGGDLFVHHSNVVRAAGTAELATGDRVEFKVGDGRRGPEALEVRVAGAPREASTDAPSSRPARTGARRPTRGPDRAARRPSRRAKAS